ncbi:hypothetical protein AYI69_g3518 [Smittium culicis]|uniref:Uncharacterized protein n=1 Tax=Smittium culicis TaxID=133412 RepID=A0A1R1YJH3_9FUNG|nr:hypothetical protein AYI69_g3518 [Smittium culicis]
MITPVSILPRIQKICLQAHDRALLSEVAATVTRARLNNLHKELDFPGNPTQFIESETKPLIEQDALDALIANTTPEKLQRFQPFRKNQQSSTQLDSISSNTVKAPSTSAATTAEAGTKTSEYQKNFRGRDL